MSSPDDALDEGLPSTKQTGTSPSLNNSSEDSITVNDNTDDSTVLEKPADSVDSYEEVTDELKCQNSTENESDKAQQATEKHNVEPDDDICASNRKLKKPTQKKIKQRRASKDVTLVGWSGLFPNLSSTYSLESNSDPEQAQLPTDLKSICATGLSIFPREVNEQQPPLSSPSANSASLSSVSELKTTVTTTTADKANSTQPSQNSSDITNKNNNNNEKSNDNKNESEVASLPIAAIRPRSGKSEPEPETESQSDLAKQKLEVKKGSPVATDIPVLVAGEEIDSSIISENRSTRKRAISNKETPDEDLPETKRLKALKESSVGNSRSRSQSLNIPTPKILPRQTRACSVCPATLAIQAKADAQITEASAEVKSLPSQRTMASDKLLPTDKFYSLPFKYGWKRELVLRSNASVSRQRGDVIFISPSGKKLRSREDIIPLLTGELTIDHFCFQRQLQQAGEQYETVRYAQPAPVHRKSSTPAKQPAPNNSNASPISKVVSNTTNSTPLQSLNAPVSGKRVPKPKVPKGASPPPEGWTSTMAVKGNARVLAASNSNNSAGVGSGSSQSARKRSNQLKQAAKAAAAAASAAAAAAAVNSNITASVPAAPQAKTAVPSNAQLPSVMDKTVICVYCLKSINEKQHAVPVGAANSYICTDCVKPGGKVANIQLTNKSQPAVRGPPNGVGKQSQIKGTVNANAKDSTGSGGGAVVDAEQNVNGNKKTKSNSNSNTNGNGNGSGGLLEIGGEIELPGALPPDQLLSDDTPASRFGRKITPRPMEVVVINGRKALAIAGEPPRPHFQLFPRTPDLESYERYFQKRNSKTKEKRQTFVECISAGNLSCQLMLAVAKTLDLHDRVRMSNVCKTWAMIARDRSVWRTMKLRDTRITNWLLLVRDMARFRTYDLDMMGIKMDNPKMRMEVDLRVLKALRILRTDPSEAEFIQSVIKRMPRLHELRTTCTSRTLNLNNLDKMTELRVLRIRMLEPKASILSLQPLQNMQQLKELSLRGINNMAHLELSQLQGLKNLETLVLGSCRGMKVQLFGQVLPNLKRLRQLRLENHHSNRSFNVNEIMEGIAAGGSVKRLELINVNVDAELSRQLAACGSVQELLLMPNFHSNTAYMMYYIMQAINENSEQLHVFRLGLTYELLSVTRALAMNQEKDCIPVALPIPGVPENDVLNESDEPIAYLPVDRLESILHHMMPQAWLTVAKVSQGGTTNLKFLPALPTDSAGISHN